MTLDPISLGLTLALNAASMAMNASRRIEGPRLSDLSVTVAEYGTPIPSFMGIRRFEGTPIIFAEPLKEVKKRRKTKGGKYNDYTYFGTWACLIADHLISAVTRIWFDKHLVYDATGEGPVTPFNLGNGFALEESVRIYLGTEDQQPDPRMQATVDAKHGAGSTPAYRGVAYVMFEEVPLAQIGNHIPQVSIEAVTAADPTYPWEKKASPIDKPYNGNGFAFSPDFSRFVYTSSDDYAIWDTASRSLMLSGTLPETIEGVTSGSGIANDGRLFMPAGSEVKVFSPDGLLFDGSIAMPADSCTIKQVANGDEYLCAYPGLTVTEIDYFALDGMFGGPASIDTTDLVAGGFTTTQWLVDAYGSLWAVGAYQAPFSGGVKPVFFYRVHDSGGNPGSPGFGQADGLTLGALAQVRAAHVAGQFVISVGDGQLHAVDDGDFSIITSAPFSTYSGAEPLIWEVMPPGKARQWIGPYEYDFVSLAQVRALNTSDWAGSVWNGLQVYDPINRAIITTPGVIGADELYWNYLDRIGASVVMLGDIVDRVAAKAGIAAGDIDASALDQPVAGYSWSQGTGKDILEPLLDLYDTDAREHGFVLAFVKRGGASASTIPSTGFAADGEGAEAGPLYEVDRGLSTDVPRRLTLSFADIDADQQTNSVSEARPVAVVEGDGELSIDMTTLAGDVTTMRGLAQRLLRRRWMGRETLQNGLPATRIALEPADVATLVLDGVSRKSRLTLMAIDADQVMRCEWERDDPSIAALTSLSGAGFDGRAPSVIAVPVPSKAFVLDIPLIADAHAAVTPSFYHAAAPYDDGGSWPGETLLQSVDAGVNYELEKAAIPSTSPAVWGLTTDALADANPNIWDRGNSVNVRLQSGTLDGTTEDQIDASPASNLALLGGELIQFVSATLEGDGTYTLSGLKRGRRGTEWATGGHVTGETFVLLDAAAVVAMGASDVGTTLYFKGVTVGRDATGAFPVTIGFTGASLKPYAPAHVEAFKDPGTGDWVIEWVRRTRVGGAWTGGAAIPLGEASEAYEVVIVDGLGAAVRTITVTTPTATYTAAQQSADGGDVPAGSLHLRVYQMSDTVGRGFAAPADF